MSVTHLPEWDATAIEIALDLERLQFDDSPVAIFSGPAEPRICVVTCFALISQLKRIVAAVDRVIPRRLPGLRIAPAPTRGDPPRDAGSVTTRPGTVAIAPMLSLLRLQYRLIRAIQPGLADQRAAIEAARSDLDDASAHFIGDFIANSSLPTLEPPVATVDFSPTRFRATGITIYRLGGRGVPRSILGHWAYAQSAGASVHLRSGPEAR
ncbi:MAG TPA: hypothetical protein VGF86_06225 [Candidatus Tumulicola sp.]|jgi:hypothetical protein